MNSLVVTLPESKISITGWKGARVTRSIESCTGSFVLEMTERFPEEVDEASLIGGAPIQIAIDADNLSLTGYVDTVEYIITPHEHLVRATGRGKCQDLIDCCLGDGNAERRPYRRVHNAWRADVYASEL
ncbi:phage baseplate assembly protein [Caballeronia zhejiangensis]|uniref:phage baseplate assembly protein n=1 Tax=Caballeronia zhejiangensis TaxID=871203 RepID=UPI001FD3790D|nr:hypothetical protein [Caballeronia zhejiangensis]